MRKISKAISALLLAAAMLPVAAPHANAFNWGFMRAPDWMDPYFVALIVVQVPFWVGLAFTKPAHVAWDELYRAELPPLASFFHYSAATLYIALMVLFFAGMGLARMSEAGV